MKIALVTDTHFGNRNDLHLFLDYFFGFFEEVFFPYLKKHKIKHVIHLGDLMHRRKYVNYLTLYRTRNEYLQWFDKNKVKMDLVLGNHDVMYKNTNKVNSPTEIIGDKYKYINVVQEPIVKEFDELPIMMIPWITQENEEACLEALKNGGVGTAKADILLGHFEIKGYEMYAGIKAKNGLSHSMFKRYDQVFSGHFHHRSDNGKIVYLGTPYQMTFNDLGDKRGFHIFDTETQELEFIESPRTMFEKVVYNDEGVELKDLLAAPLPDINNKFVRIVVEKKNNAYWFDKWLERIHKAEPYDLTIIDLTTYEIDDSIEPVAEGTLDVLMQHVRDQEFSVSSEKLESTLVEVYHEALEVAT